MGREFLRFESQLCAVDLTQFANGPLRTTLQSMFKRYNIQANEYRNHVTGTLGQRAFVESEIGTSNCLLRQAIMCFENLF